MAKVSPYGLNVRPQVAFERTLTDSQNPGVNLTLRLRRLSSMERIAALNLAENMIVEYVTGTGTPGRKDYAAPMPLPPVGGQPVSISEGTARIACLVCRAQTTPEADRYTFEELISFMVSDEFCEGIAGLVELVAPDEEATKPDPLAQVASGATSSPTASTETPRVTRPSSHTSATPSIASTSDSEPSPTPQE